MNSPSSRLTTFQPMRTWRFRLCALYWVARNIFRSPELMQFESVKSTMRYGPPNGTAGLARSRVRG